MWNDAIVLDTGSSTIKAGVAGDDAPSVVFPNVIGKPKYNKAMIVHNQKDEYVGNEAMKFRGVLTLDYPIKNGVICNWDAAEKIFHHMYQELHLPSNRQPVLFTEPPWNPKRNREKTTELFFEKLEVPQFYIALQAILGVYASGRGCAFVLDIGEGVSHMIPVFEGYTVREAITRVNMGGRDVTQNMASLLNQRGHSFFTTAELEIVRELKEQTSYVALNFNDETKKQKFKEVNYELPDGQIISVGEERFTSPEILFSPFLVGSHFSGIHELLHGAIEKCGMDTRRTFYGNIVLSGGSSMLPGIEKRLSREMNILSPHHLVRVIASPERMYSTWIGGSILASLSTFQMMWITREEYDETGPNIVHRKCL